MTILINDSSRYAAAASRALSLAIRALALANEIDALQRDIRAARDEPVRRAGFRCDTAIGWMRQASAELQDTSDHLDRIAAAMKPGACPVPWGVCPEHGNTLTSTGRPEDVVPEHRVRPDVGLRPRRPAVHGARPVESDRHARRSLRDVRR
jgi:hypothetical protein